MSLITDKVKTFYSTHPYPNYPLLANPLWQYGYLGSSFFASNLFEQIYHQPSSIYQYNTTRSYKDPCNQKNILIIGCGQILPYVSRKFEFSNHKIYCVDLSKASLQRARFRLVRSLNMSPIYFIEDDIIHFLDSNPDLKFDHIDCFGVLHHLSSPSEALSKVTSHMKPQSTIRIMVYNYPARWWIHYLASVLKLQNISDSKEGISKARSWIKTLLTFYPSSYLKEYLDCFGKRSFNDNTIFSDTFLHPREIRYDISRWFKLFESCSLKAFSMFDRYSELEDLCCSLYKVPSIKLLLDKAYSFDFLENLEIYLTPASFLSSSSSDPKTSLRNYSTRYKNYIFFKEFFFHLFKTSPFTEITHGKQKIWYRFLKGVLFDLPPIGSTSHSTDQLYQYLRLGYIFPKDIDSSVKDAGRYKDNNDNKSSLTTASFSIDQFDLSVTDIKDEILLNQNLDPKVKKLLKLRLSRLLSRSRLNLSN